MKRAFAVAVLLVAAFAAYQWCVVDLLLLPEKRAFNAMKNRTALPTSAEVDSAATLEALLMPGEDRARWSQQRAAVVEGFVIRVFDGGPESANCFSLTRVDAHIELATRPDAPANQRFIVEVTPPMRDWAARQSMDWSTPALQRTLTAQRVRIQGWLFFDDRHDEESENSRPGRAQNWRATAWEIHPVTAIEVVQSSKFKV